ncbi:MAG TPA: hypothetical protein VGK63_01280, partial [Candidatus Limnocylindrales bacterium]
ELLDAGRETYLAVGSAGWAPRRYRGRDIFRWLWALAADGARVGVPFPTADRLPDPRMRLVANPQLSGHGGGHDVDLRALAQRGLGLVNRVVDVDGERVDLAPGLDAALRRSEGFFDERFRPLIDRYIELAGVDAPADQRTRSRFVPPERAALDLGRAGVSTVIWASGYRPDFGWIDALPLDEQGLPLNRRGVTEIEGLGFLGLLWQHTQASATLFGPTQDAAYLLGAMGLDPAAPIDPPTPPQRPARTPA